MKDVTNTVYTEQEWDVHTKITDASMIKYINGSFKNVLDVGCGTGYAMRKFKEMGIDPIGITLDDNEYKAHKFNGYDVRVMDMSFLDFEDEEFELIWCRHSLEHSVMPYISLRELNRVLSPEGYMYVEVPSPTPPHIANPSHYSMLDDLSLQELFRRTGFKLLDRGQYALQVPGEPGQGDQLLLYWSYWLRKN